MPLALRTTTLHHRPPAVAVAAAAAAMPCPSGCGNASAAAIPSWSTTCQAPARWDQLPSSATTSRTRSTRAMTNRLIPISTMKLRQVFAPFTYRSVKLQKLLMTVNWTHHLLKDLNSFAIETFRVSCSTHKWYNLIGWQQSCDFSIQSNNSVMSREDFSVT